MNAGKYSKLLLVYLYSWDASSYEKRKFHSVWLKKYSNSLTSVMADTCVPAFHRTPRHLLLLLLLLLKEVGNARLGESD